VKQGSHKVREKNSPSFPGPEPLYFSRGYRNKNFGSWHKGVLKAPVSLIILICPWKFTHKEKILPRYINSYCRMQMQAAPAATKYG